MFLDAAEIIRDEDVLITTYRSGITVDQEKAIEIDMAHLTLSAGKDMFILADFSSGNIQMEESAKEFFMNQGKMMPYTKAVAIVGNASRKGWLAKLLKRNKKWYEVKRFDNIEDAMKWFEDLRVSELAVA